MKNFEPKDKIIAITGAGSGVGRGLARAFARAGAKALALADIDEQAVTGTAAELGAFGCVVDVANEADIAGFIEQARTKFGSIDLFCSNAGILTSDAPDFTAWSRSTEEWQRTFEVNVLSHVHVCRALLPAMVEQGEGALMITASAAGLLSQIGGMAYATTKHAAVGLAESIAITHGDDGIYVSVLCPQAIETDMLRGIEKSSAALDGAMDPDELARHTLGALAEGQFMIRPHRQVEDYFKAKADNYDRWVGGMRKLRRHQRETTGKPM